MARSASLHTMEEIEQEIERLRNSEFVKLARKEQRLRYKRRQTLYQLRNLDKRGRELAESGLTLETMEEQLSEDELTMLDETED